MENLKFTSNKTMTTPELFGRLFQLRDQMHLVHLSTKSYEVHVAIGSFYEGLVDLLDGLIESYQGKYGVQTITIPSSTSTINEILTLKTIAKLIDGGESYTKLQETYLQNQLDEITKLIYSTIYKLENLK